MGDFERTFGAGADSVAIVDEFSQHFYDRDFPVSAVQYTQRGVAQWVNCAYRVERGEMVLVRLGGHRSGLRWARVVDPIEYRSTPLEDTIVCRSRGASSYKNGPSAIKTFEDLDLFLTDSMEYKKFPVKHIIPNRPHLKEGALIDVGVAYTSIHIDGDGDFEAGTLVEIRTKGIYKVCFPGRFSPTDVSLHDGAITRTPSSGFYLDIDDGSYNEIAKLVESFLSVGG